MAQAHAITKDRDNCRVCKCLLDMTEREKGVCEQCERDDRDTEDAVADADDEDEGEDR